jgi:hypothetical protein
MLTCGAGLYAKREWSREEVGALARSELTAAIRADLNRVLQAIGEPRRVPQDSARSMWRPEIYEVWRSGLPQDGPDSASGLVASQASEVGYVAIFRLSVRACRSMRVPPAARLPARER